MNARSKVVKCYSLLASYLKLIVGSIRARICPFGVINAKTKV